MEKNSKWRELIKNLPMNECYYSLDGKQKPDCLILDKFKNKWKVYYFSERGTVNNEHVFETEDEACEYLYNELHDMIITAKKYGKNI